MAGEGSQVVQRKGETPGKNSLFAVASDRSGKFLKRAESERGVVTLSTWQCLLSAAWHLPTCTGPKRGPSTSLQHLIAQAALQMTLTQLSLEQTGGRIIVFD